jgi:hypothetical protein
MTVTEKTFEYPAPLRRAKNYREFANKSRRTVMDAR